MRVVDFSAEDREGIDTLWLSARHRKRFAAGTALRVEEAHRSGMQHFTVSFRPYGFEKKSRTVCLDAEPLP